VKFNSLSLIVGVWGALLAGCAGGRRAGDAAPSAAVASVASVAVDSSGEADEGSGRWRTYETGIASWYGGRWHGRKTANGERYNQNSMTAAHKKLPFNTRVRVTNLRTGKSCIVRINNRGPHIRGRVIDLSVAAAKKIGSHAGGLSRVKLEVER
jgi:rare lipoprotein A